MSKKLGQGRMHPRVFGLLECPALLVRPPPTVPIGLPSVVRIFADDGVSGVTRGDSSGSICTSDLLLKGLRSFVSVIKFASGSRQTAILWSLGDVEMPCEQMRWPLTISFPRPPIQEGSNPKHQSSFGRKWQVEEWL